MNVIPLILIIQLVEHADPIIHVIIFMKLILKVAVGHHASSIYIYLYEELYIKTLSKASLFLNQYICDTFRGKGVLCKMQSMYLQRRLPIHTG